MARIAAIASAAALSGKRRGAAPQPDQRAGERERHRALHRIGKRHAAAPHAHPREHALDLVPAGAAGFEHLDAREMAGGEERAPHLRPERERRRERRAPRPSRRPRRKRASARSRSAPAGSARRTAACRRRARTARRPAPAADRASTSAAPISAAVRKPLWPWPRLTNTAGKARASSSQSGLRVSSSAPGAGAARH